LPVIPSGKIISGKYKILEEIGRGGMGVVYKAVDTKLDRTVALKFLSPSLIRNETAQKRLIQEAKAAAALNHPHITTIYEVNEDDGQAYIAMEFIEGKSVKDKLQAGPLDMDEALDIAAQVAIGLSEAHKKGIIHRDIKPSNIMLTETGVAKITDFGLAKLSWGPDLTQVASIIGTVSYMSPEHVRGEEVDHRSDIWSMGAMLYEMLSNKRPFQGDQDHVIIYSILHKDPTSLVSLRPEIPEYIEKVILKALAKDAALRNQSSQDFLEELKPSLLSAAAAGHAPKKPKTKYLVVFASVVLLLILSGVYAVYQHLTIQSQKQMAVELFATIKEQELRISELENAEDTIRLLAENRSEYDRMIAELGLGKKSLEDKLIFRMARIFGESEVELSEDFILEVKSYIKKWQSDDIFLTTIKRAQNNNYIEYIIDELERQHLAPQFIYLALQESRFDTEICGPSTALGYAKGMWQLMPQTAKNYNLKIGPEAHLPKYDPLDERHDFRKSTQAVARYFRDIYETDAQASGLLVLAAYNLGETTALNLIRKMPDNPSDRNFSRLISNHVDQIPQNTYDYVLRIFSAAVIGENPKYFGFDFDNPISPFVDS